MRDWNRSEEGSARRALLLWAAAGLVVLAVHAAAAVWLLGSEPPVADGDVPLAIMIDLSPLDSAEGEDERSEASDLLQSEEPDVLPEEEVPEEPPIEEPEQEEPPEDEQEWEEPLVEPEQIAVPLPVPSVKPPPPRIVRRDVPKPIREEPAARPTQAEAPIPSERAASSQTVSRPAVPSAASTRWMARVMAHLERRKNYPSGARARREEGVAEVRFLIDEAGNVLSAKLEKSSGYAELDAEVLALARRASPVPAPPPDAGRSIVAPIRFTIR